MLNRNNEHLHDEWQWKLKFTLFKLCSSFILLGSCAINKSSALPLIRFESTNTKSDYFGITTSAFGLSRLQDGIEKYWMRLIKSVILRKCAEVLQRLRLRHTRFFCVDAQSTKSIQSMSTMRHLSVHGAPYIYIKYNISLRAKKGPFVTPCVRPTNKKKRSLHLQRRWHVSPLFHYESEKHTRHIFLPLASPCLLGVLIKREITCFRPRSQLITSHFSPTPNPATHPQTKRTHHWNNNRRLPEGLVNNRLRLLKGLRPYYSHCTPSTPFFSVSDYRRENAYTQLVCVYDLIIAHIEQ